MWSTPRVSDPFSTTSSSAGSPDPSRAEPASAASAGKPVPLNLPRPQHASRLPAGIGPEQLLRIRQAAYQLPQVLTPADVGAASGEASAQEAALDRAGLVLLQKAVAGARPSRWIAPRLMAVALAHLDVVGTAPTVRALMQQRTVLLDGLGLSREGQGWSRLCRLNLKLALPGWQIPVAFRVPLEDDGPVWAFYRDGDLHALKAALGQQPPYAHAAELQAHLAQLLARSEAGHPEHLDSLLPRLQAECAMPQAFELLKAGCTRAQDRWEHRVAELNTLAGLNSELAFQGYPDTFDAARRLQRTVTLYVGPPNSGKTYAAFERLAQAHEGAYLAPLRLLALEGRDRLVGRGVPCSLLTGEENVPADGARVVSSTIEMVNTNKPIDVAVIDEAQMLFDLYRGWAWTQAIVAVPANEVIIICSAYAVPAIESLLGLCGERCTVRHFERKQEVQLLPAPVPIAALKKRRRRGGLQPPRGADAARPDRPGRPPGLGHLRRPAARGAAARGRALCQRRGPHPGRHRCHRHGPEPADPARAVQHHEQVRRPGRPRTDRLRGAPDRRSSRPLWHA